MSKLFTFLNIVFLVEVIVFVMVVFGFWPREAFLPLALLLILFVSFADKRESLLLIIRSIPFFFALPISNNFDSLNIWRVLILILFLRWFFWRRFFLFLDAIFKLFKIAKGSFKKAWVYIIQHFKVEFLYFLIFFISLLSLIKAEYLTEGVKRIIYFANASVLFFIIRSYAQSIGLRRIALNLLLPVFFVVVFGFVQLYMAYVMNINQFTEFWALQVEKSIYGNKWANIALKANTWFAYYNDAIKLRIFSTFPDTHSLPLYLLMTSPFIIFLILKNDKHKFKKALLWLLLLSVLFIVIMTGTRGIWAAFMVVFLSFFFFKKKFNVSREVFNPIFSFLLAFLLLLPFAGLVFQSSQFNISQAEINETNILKERIVSIVDTEEVSNKGRIYIWKNSIKSIVENPLLGVGINNFPVILKESITKTKAGSSAHNIYLNVAAEIGIFGLLVFLLMVYVVLFEMWRVYRFQNDIAIKAFIFSSFLIFLWMLIYTNTDVAITDGRAFLMLMIFLGVIFSFNYAKR